MKKLWLATNSFLPVNASGVMVQTVSLLCRILGSWVFTISVALNPVFISLAMRKGWKLWSNSLPIRSHFLPGFSNSLSLLVKNQEEKSWREKKLKTSGSPQWVCFLFRIFSSPCYLHISPKSSNTSFLNSPSLVLFQWEIWLAMGRTSRTRLKRLSRHAWIGEGHGNPLQCSCLENPRDRGAWWAASMGSHRVGHDWSDLAAVAAAYHYQKQNS